jgi:hypothetical protein
MDNCVALLVRVGTGGSWRAVRPASHEAGYYTEMMRGLQDG